MLEGKTPFSLKATRPHLGHILCPLPEGPQSREAQSLQLAMLWTLCKAHLPTPLCPQAMESKLLIGGRNIMDHTNEQQKMLELKRQEIAEQVGPPGARSPWRAWPAARIWEV